MQLTIDEANAKRLLKEALVELMNEREDWFFALMVEAFEEVGLANAIREGRQNDFVDQSEIFAILEGLE
jgi:hypothetical protein